MTTMAHNWKPSEAQVNLLKTIFSERVPDSEPNRGQFWKNLTQNISNRESFQTAIDALKARPRVQNDLVERVTPVADRPALATEDGLYRNPADGTLYRLSTPKPLNSWTKPQTVVSVYSNKANIRRLTPEGRLVKKGKWTRLKAHESRQMLTYSRWDRPGQVKVEASWLMSDEEKGQWAVGICLMCYRGLVDGVSVYNQIGPVCARNWGFELQMPPV